MVGIFSRPLSSLLFNIACLCCKVVASGQSAVGASIDDRKLKVNELVICDFIEEGMPLESGL